MRCYPFFAIFVLHLFKHSHIRKLKMSIFYLSFKNCFAKPLTTLLTTVLFALGVGLTVFLLLFNTQIETQLDRNLAGIDLMVGAKGSPMQMVLSGIYHIDNPTGNIKLQDVAFLMRNPNVKQTIPQALGDAFRGFRICGTSHAYVDLYDGKLAEGLLWSKDFECTIGSEVAAKTHLQVGNPLVSAHGLAEGGEAHAEQPFKIVGILKPTGTVLDQLVLTSVASVWDMHNTHHGAQNDAQNDARNQGAIAGDSVRTTDDMQREITSLLVFYKDRSSLMSLNLPRLINQNTVLQAASPIAETARLYQLIGNGTQLLSVLGYLIGLLSAFSVFIALLNALRDRQYELALMRMLGGGRSILFRTILIEGFILALFGAISGFILAHLALHGIHYFAPSNWHYQFTGRIFLYQEIYIFFAALCIGLLAAFFPALRAAQTEIATTLKR
jgi:putative ABC transport system permease protein